MSQKIKARIMDGPHVGMEFILDRVYDRLYVAKMDNPNSRIWDDKGFPTIPPITKCVYKPCRVHEDETILYYYDREEM